MNIDQLVRPNILSLQPYSSARDEFSGSAQVFLDANENSLGSVSAEVWNRYPDPQQRKIKSRLAEIKGVSEKNIFLGNGSDEAIDILFRVFCEPGKDKALIFTPTYGMYEVSARINNVELVSLELDECFRPTPIPTEIRNQVKLIFLCSPNNPTGNLVDPNFIKDLLRDFNGIVVLDEAYIDYAIKESWLPELTKYPNLIILQTFSKAWGLAALRLGVAYASEKIIGYMNRVKPPYNINEVTQNLVLAALQNTQRLSDLVNETLLLRTELIEHLSTVSSVIKIYPSLTNFVLVEVSDAQKIYQYLVERGIVVRNRHSVVQHCLRITVGTAQENKQLIASLKSYQQA